MHVSATHPGVDSDLGHHNLHREADLTCHGQLLPLLYLVVCYVSLLQLHTWTKLLGVVLATGR